MNFMELLNFIVISYFAFSIYSNKQFELLHVDYLVLMKRSLSEMEESDIESSPNHATNKRARLENWNKEVQEEKDLEDLQYEEQMILQLDIQESCQKLNDSNITPEVKTELVNEIVKNVSLFHDLDGDIQELDIFSLIDNETDYLIVKSLVSDKTKVDLIDKELFVDGTIQDGNESNSNPNSPSPSPSENKRDKGEGGDSNNGVGTSSGLTNTGGGPSNSTPSSANSNFSLFDQILFWFLLILNYLIELISGYTNLF